MSVPRWWWIIVGFVYIKMTLDMEGLRSLSLGPWRGIVVILIGGIPLTPLPRLVVEPWFKAVSFLAGLQVKQVASSRDGQQLTKHGDCSWDDRQGRVASRICEGVCSAFEANREGKLGRLSTQLECTIPWLAGVPSSHRLYQLLDCIFLFCPSADRGSHMG